MTETKDPSNISDNEPTQKKLPLPMRSALRFGGEFAVAIAKLLPHRLWENLVYIGISRVGSNAPPPVFLDQGRSLGQAQSRLATYEGPRVLATYTGRIMQIREPLDLAELGLTANTDKEAEHAFRVWFEGKEGKRKLDDLLVNSEGDASSISFRQAISNHSSTFRAILHEYTHWAIFNGTSLATLADGASWRVRLCELTLCETIHDRVGIPRLLDPEGVAELRSLFPNYLNQLDKRVATDSLSQLLLVNLALHHYLTDLFYQTAAAVIIEPVTWALVEPDFIENETKLNQYFGGSKTLHALAASVLAQSRDYLRKGRSRKELVQAAKGALDLPFRDMRYQNGSAEALLDLAETLVQRLRALLNDHKIPLAPAREKTFGSAIVYAVGLRTGNKIFDSEVKRLMVNAGATILKREAEIFRYGVNIVQNTYGTPNYSTPTIFAYARVGNGKLLKLRYDKLTGLSALTDKGSAIDRLKTKTTGKTLDRIDDLVGDLPSTLGTALWLIPHLEMAKYQAIIDEFPKLRHLSEKGLKAQLESAMRALEDYRRELGLERTGIERSDEASLRHFFWFWLKFLAVVGEPARFMYPEHGL